MMSKLSIIENQMIRDSVDLTVEKLRFSRVRKYFCVRAISQHQPPKHTWNTKANKRARGFGGGGGLQIVDNWPESLKNDSSRLSGDSLF